MRIDEEDRKNLEFLLYLSSLTPEQLKAKRQRDRLKFFKDLNYLFFGSIPPAEKKHVGGRLDRAIREAEADPTQLEKAMVRAKQIVDTFSGGEARPFTLSGGLVISINAFDDPKDPDVTWDSSSIEDVLMLAAIDLLDDDPSIRGRVVRCELKQCEKVFLQSRSQQKFCSRGCAQKVAASAYRDRHRKKLRDKARSRYQRRQKEKHGSNVKVGWSQKNVKSKTAAR